MSTWEERMAAKAAARRAERDQIERAADELRRAEEERRLTEWRATLPPCPCPYDPCPMPPEPDGYWVGWWKTHRQWWEDFYRTGRCPDCGKAMTVAEVDEHNCPNGIALAG